MPDFFQLSEKDRTDALNVAAGASGRPPHLLEKDIWVVWTLRHLFTGPYAEHLVFKGGTSLSKAYGVIRRFSEDVDLTYDIRAIAGDLVGNADFPPASKNQAKNWSKEIRRRLAEWVAAEIVPRFQQDLSAQGLSATVRADGDKAFVEYAALTAGTGYVAPTVMLEFGARSTGEPNELRPVQCDAAHYLQTVEFPTATPRVMRAERTFWEKATAIHVFCIQGSFRGGERFARHWHDLTRLDAGGIVDSAIGNLDLARAVASHKSIFFPENDPQGGTIDYRTAIGGSLQLIPDDEALAKLASDYQHMVDDGLFLDDAESFDDLLEKCRVIEQRVNAEHKLK
jgi:hypothetical protein